MKKISVAVSLLLLSSCVPTPTVVEVERPVDATLTCEQLANEMAYAEQMKINAKAEDGFRFSYMFPPSGLLAIYNMNHAESHAIDRMEHLNNVMKSKACTTAENHYPPEPMMYNGEVPPAAGDNKVPPQGFPPMPPPPGGMPMNDSMDNMPGGKPAPWSIPYNDGDY